MIQTSPQELTIVKPHWLKRGLRIYEGKTQVGKIEYTKRFRLDAVATFLDERWKINQTGFWKSFLEFSSSGQPFSKIKIHPTFGGKLEWNGTDGKSFIFRKIKWWKNTWAWFDENGNAVIEIRPDHSFTNKQAYISILDRNLKDYRLMSLIGIFIYQVQKSRAAAAAT